MIRAVRHTLFAHGVLLGCLVSAPAFAQDSQTSPPARILLAQEMAPGAQAPQTPQQRAAQVKLWMQASQAQLRSYQWTETTVVSVNGEQKSTTVKRCFYGPDGKVQKVVLSQTPAAGGGMPGILPLGMLINRAEKKKKEQMEAYMKSAQELVHSYIPPSPGLIQQSINSGNLGMRVLAPGQTVRVTFGNYLKPGDSLGFDVALPTNQLLDIAVSSYLDTTDNPVTLNVTMSMLPDGTIHAAQAILTASAKGITVNVQNAGYQRIAQ